MIEKETLCNSFEIVLLSITTKGGPDIKCCFYVIDVMAFFHTGYRFGYTFHNSVKFDA